jgi:hypothetical protein
LVRIGVGRDAADVPVANVVGQAILRQQSVAAVESELQSGNEADSSLAISTA